MNSKLQVAKTKRKRPSLNLSDGETEDGDTSSPSSNTTTDSSSSDSSATSVLSAYFSATGHSQPSSSSHSSSGQDASTDHGHRDVEVDVNFPCPICKCTTFLSSEPDHKLLSFSKPRPSISIRKRPSQRFNGLNGRRATWQEGIDIYSSAQDFFEFSSISAFESISSINGKYTLKLINPDSIATNSSQTGTTSSSKSQSYHDTNLTQLAPKENIDNWTTHLKVSLGEIFQHSDDKVNISINSSGSSDISLHSANQRKRKVGLSQEDPPNSEADDNSSKSQNKDKKGKRNSDP